VDRITDDVDDLTGGGSSNYGNENNSNIQDTVQVSFNLPDSPQITYNDSTGTITLTDENGNEQTIELPKDENGNTEFPVTVVDGGGDTYVVTKDEDGEVFVTKPQTINENGSQNNNNNLVDTVKAKEKVKELIPILQERIKNNLSSETDLFLKYAYDEVEILTSIVSFNPNVSFGGRYVNGQLFVGTYGFKNGSTDEDIMATIFHEYMHYLNKKYKIYEYRMENEREGEIYSFNIQCFYRKIESESEFLERIYQTYIFYLYNSTENIYEIMNNYPSSYENLTTEQDTAFREFIKDKEYVPIEKCFPYQYLPSNFCKDEITAHNETLKANNMNVFTMSKANVDFYFSEIKRYEEKYEIIKKYEIDNNINPDGYEK
jgi:hypothetical protein